MKIERYLTQNDAATLSRLAEELLRLRDVKVNAGEKLIELISGSMLLPENVRRKDCVSLYSEVTYCKIGPDDQHTVTIVCPQDANQTLAHVSILAPIAMALIGRKLRSIVEVELPFGNVQFVKILDIRPLTGAGMPEPSEGEDAAVA
ncbi:GreA/GreB family elongation factor [Noviherbaspirillum massiliense]|uniref:GreA/GreB family elongation factor n=1 Tax=Noviherbaspirillum massiliense TaxID=1465823 RepID=UPI0002E7767D|nr:GreA/GreB family elongation factor [Noviherbaspirillum massiliense]